MEEGRTNKIAKNTIILYVQMLLGLFIGLYTSRVILSELGIEDFGIYNVVGGLVVMFGLLNMSMSSTTSRFITVALGEGIETELKKMFGMTLSIHLLLALGIVVLAEPIGLWFLKNEMKIPADRMDAAIVVFHCSIATMFISLLNVPYNALIVAHERMSIYAYFSLIDLLLRLSVVLVLPFYTMDKLKFYAVLILGVQTLMQLIYWLYCVRNFHEARVLPKWDSLKMKKMFSFAGWSLFGDASALMFTQGLNMLLNVFFGPVVNAARGIAVQVQGVVQRFISSFQTALNPQLIKSYANKDYAYMHKLLYASSKFSFFLFLILALPVFFETKILLTWWLKNIPEYSIVFIRIILLISLIDCLSNPLVISAKANGNIKKYQIVLGSFMLIIVPISYIFLYLGYPPYSVFVVHLIIALIGHYLRIKLVSPLIELNVSEYMREVIGKVFLVFSLANILPLIIISIVQESMLRFFIISALSVVVTSILIWLFGINMQEKAIISEQLNRMLRKSKLKKV